MNVFCFSISILEILKRRRACLFRPFVLALYGCFLVAGMVFFCMSFALSLFLSLCTYAYLCRISLFISWFLFHCLSLNGVFVGYLAHMHLQKPYSFFFSRNQMKCESVIEIPQKCESGMSGSINCITWQICTFWPAQPYGRTTSRRLNNSFLINDQINPENQNVYA